MPIIITRQNHHTVFTMACKDMVQNFIRTTNFVKKKLSLLRSKQIVENNLAFAVTPPCLPSRPRKTFVRKDTAHLKHLRGLNYKSLGWRLYIYIYICIFITSLKQS